MLLLLRHPHHQQLDIINKLTHLINLKGHMEEASILNLNEDQGIMHSLLWSLDINLDFLVQDTKETSPTGNRWANVYQLTIHHTPIWVAMTKS